MAVAVCVGMRHDSLQLLLVHWPAERALQEQLSEWLVDADLKEGRLVDLFPQHESTATNFDSSVWLLYASREHVPRRVRAFIDFVKSKLGNLEKHMKHI